MIEYLIMSWFLNNFIIYTILNIKNYICAGELRKNFLSYLDGPKLPTINSKLEKAAKLH